MTEECPTCGDSFSTSQGMKSHHTQVHGESISGFTYTCDNCGNDFTSDHDDKSTYKFCSVECQNEWQSDYKSGKNNPMYSGGEYKKCCVCGDNFWCSPYQIDFRKTCSKSCLGNKQSDDFSGSGNPNWSGGEYKECEVCGDKFWDIPSEDGRFCSYECMGKERHKGGQIVYGNKWRKKRNEVRERYDMCQMCGNDPEETMHVHHIVPAREFDDPADAHFFTNLTLVCRSCHPSVEAMSVKEQMERLKWS